MKVVKPRIYLGILMAMLMTSSCRPFTPDYHQEQDWQRFVQRFVSPTGRIVDTGNEEISHSEGQAWGMWLAVAFNDRERFEQIWQWTREHLQIRETDRLFAWRWYPNQARNPVPDWNNASDADLYIAWALLRASQRWNEANYLGQSKEILQDVQQHVIRDYAGYTVLLPGSTGFEHGDHVVLNLSYWIFPALAEFAEAGLGEIWEQLHDSGVQLLNRARFGQWQLPPDWISLTATGEINIAHEFPPRFGYEAIRIPLLLTWARVEPVELLRSYHRYAAHFDAQQCQPAAWTNLHDNSLAPYSLSAGGRHILSLVNFRLNKNHAQPPLPRLTDNQDYYSATLLMLAKQAVKGVTQ